MFVPVYESLQLHANNDKLSNTTLSLQNQTSNEMRQRIQNARIKNRLSLNTLSERTEIPVESIASFERGDELLDTQDLQKIINALKINLKE